MTTVPDDTADQSARLNGLALRLLGWLLVFGGAIDLALLGVVMRLSDVDPRGLAIIAGVGAAFAIVGAIALVMSRGAVGRRVPLYGPPRGPNRSFLRRWRAAIICLTGLAVLGAVLRLRGL